MPHRRASTRWRSSSFMLRIAYTFIYIGGVATVRTLVWFGGVICVGWLYLCWEL